ncbi:hypothetical protein NAEGRDRAFT_82044 [Naegleria gruberi]|uniref:Uncharacterized protein n=1 Tax=Naegleria gruberi TaxID=5762 RepID=D2W1U8_NAEGR|nr:uncharacterized protein NAEGRDRAFT_82044 [Naegleria gruberi]EFC36928.1 hypothetical protein NAEGRDRAFT_82044 [Naegleria gruberi]|eukprot:XP_002669672.1 hypothetical protein NAEGRDRAFT_82044 [Naegleria gruberi strain NEG-M]
MIMQEYFPIKKQSSFNVVNNSNNNNKSLNVIEKKLSKNPLDNFQVLVSARPSKQVFIPTVSSNVVENSIIVKKFPFPYLKRKSIRVDLVLKQQKLAQQKKNSSPIQKLRNEKKQLELENSKLKSKLLNLENQFNQLINQKSKKMVTFKQECECTKCHMSINSKYMKYHKRICGNVKLNRILNENDLKSLQLIKKNNQQEQLSIKPKNNWRRKRQEFIRQVKSIKRNNL